MTSTHGGERAPMGKRGVGRFRMLTCGLALAAGVVLLLPSTAHAEVPVGSYLGRRTVSTTGASLTCDAWKHTRSSIRYSCSLRDTAGDSSSVYALVRADSWPSSRYQNSGGNGTVLMFSGVRGSDVWNVRLNIQACRDVNLRPDNCSSWTAFQG